MTKELAGKVAVVTGAGRNIGRAIALTLAEGGASVLINARSNRSEAEAVAREIEAADGKAMVHIGDVADAKAVQAMAGAAVKDFGRIDILVNNAALRRESRSLTLQQPSGRKHEEGGMTTLEPRTEAESEHLRLILWLLHHERSQVNI